jgi:ankyrin repeat protein
MIYSWTDLFLKYEKGKQSNLSSTISEFYRVKDSNGDWAIHVASKRGHKDLVKKALDEGSYVNLRDAQGNFPLHYAARYGFYDIVCILVDKEAAVHMKNKTGSTALSLACEHGHLEVVKYLLSKGAKIDDLNNERESPLMLACKNQHLDMVKFLMENGASLSINSYLMMQLFSSSVTQRNYDLVEMLLSREIAPTTSDIFEVCQNGDLRMLRMFAERGINVNCSSEGKSSLSYASENGHNELVQFLLANGASPSSTVPSDSTKKEATKLEDISAKYGFNFNGNLFEKDLHGNLPLHRAVERGIDELVFELAAKYSNIDLKNNAGMTSLSIACEYGYLEIAKCLCSRGANLQTLNEEKESPLSLACKQNQIEMAKWLIENGAYVNLLDKNKKSIIFHAYKREFYEMADILLANGAKLTQDIFLEACQTSRHELLKILYNKQPSLFFETLEANKYILEQSLEKGHKEIMCFLLDYCSY